MGTDYQQLRQKYHDAAKAAANGDTKAKAEKAKMMNDIRAIEREAAREGRRLVPTLDVHGKVSVAVESMPTKRSMQEEYVRKFDEQKQVKIGDKVTTLREFHSKRLLGK